MTQANTPAQTADDLSLEDLFAEFDQFVAERPYLSEPTYPACQYQARADMDAAAENDD